jgi:DNA-binding transcriptional ArsR family regulator
MLWSVVAHGKSRRTVSQDAHSASPAGASGLTAAALDAVGDRTRRAILGRLVGGPLSVAELADGMAVGRPAVSQHLKVLKQAGLVTDRQVGNRRIYSLDPDGVGALRAYVDRFWTQALDAFKAAVEQDQEVS